VGDVRAYLSGTRQLYVQLNQGQAPEIMCEIRGVIKKERLISECEMNACSRTLNLFSLTDRPSINPAVKRSLGNLQGWPHALGAPSIDEFPNAYASNNQVPGVRCRQSVDGTTGY